MTNKELALEIYEEIRAEYKKPCLPYRLEPGDAGLTDSKVGGTPYLDRDEAWPVDGEGHPMIFLAQIDCAQLDALPDFPHTGLLQFFIAENDVWGLSFGDKTDTAGFRVFYRETPDPSVTAEEAAAKCPPEPEDFGTPVCRPCRIVFDALTEQGMTSEDFRLNGLFVQRWNQRRPDDPMETMWEVFKRLDGDEYDLFDRSGDVPCHQLGGYPFFTQSDPRSEDYEDMDVILFQLDSDMRPRAEGGDLVLWGDAGVGNFFISREALKQRDFSRVLYNWDCG